MPGAVWCGSVRTPFAFHLAAEWLELAGFSAVEDCAFGQSVHGEPWLAALDNRKKESFFVEALA